MKNVLLSSLLGFFLLVPSALSAGQGVGADIPITSPVYDQVDILCAYGLVKSLIVGQRPYSKTELRRIVAEAKKNLEQAGEVSGPLLHVALNQLEIFVADRPAEILGIDALTVATVAQNEQARPYPLPGVIAGNIRPLIRQQNGVTLAQGGNVFFKTEHSWQPNEHLVFQLQPRFQWQASDQADASFRAHFDEGAVKLGAWNVELGVGRQQQIWGQSRLGGLAFSNNARAFDMIHLKNISPVRIPILGNFVGTFFYGTLGPEQFFDYTHISGMKLSFKPSSNVEIAGSNVIVFQGEGAPRFSFAEGLREWFGFIPVVSQTGRQFSNRLFFLEARATFPALRYSNVYGEWMVEDKVKVTSLKKILQKDSGYLFGIFVPRLTADGHWQARFELKYFGQHAYQHNVFRDGYTMNGKILGDPLGLGARSLALELSHYFSLHTILRMHSEWQLYDDMGAGADEQRYLLTSSLRFPLAKTVSLQPELQYEYVRRFNFQLGNNKHFGSFALNLQKTFD